MPPRLDPTDHEAVTAILRTTLETMNPRYPEPEDIDHIVVP